MKKEIIIKTKNPFRAWYETKFKKTMPIYLQSEEKKKLVRQYELETGTKYSN